jgi:hypothetical protein
MAGASMRRQRRTESYTGMPSPLMSTTCPGRVTPLAANVTLCPSKCSIWTRYSIVTHPSVPLHKRMYKHVEVEGLLRLPPW